jgi:hypothetical protein
MGAIPISKVKIWEKIDRVRNRFPQLYLCPIVISLEKLLVDTSSETSHFRITLRWIDADSSHKQIQLSGSKPYVVLADIMDKWVEQLADSDAKTHNAGKSRTHNSRFISREKKHA